MSDWLVSLTEITSDDIFVDVLSHFREPIASSYELMGSTLTKVPCHFRVMAGLKDLKLEIIVVWNENKVVE